MRRAVVLGAAAALLLAAAGEEPGSRAAAQGAGEHATSDWRTRVGGAGPEWAPVRTVDGVLHVAVNDFARLLGATKFWRGDLRKLVLRMRDHRLQLTVDHPFVVLDDRTIRLDTPIVSRGGELMVPVALVDSLPSDSTLARLFYDAGRRVVLRVPPAGIVGTPRFAMEGTVSRITFPVDRPAEVLVTSRSRAHLRVRMSGFFAGVLPDSFLSGSLIEAVRPIAAAGGSAFELRIAPEATGFRVTPDPAGHRVTLAFDRDPEAELDRFAPEGPAGRRALGVVVLDPGHGGGDAGVTVSGAVEKDLTLRLARLLSSELERRIGARVVLTREDDRALSIEERAERANRARADLVIALHFDGLPDGRARGATAYCPPAIWAGKPREDAGGAILLLPWRDVGLRHAVRARELSEAVLSALELRSQGPTRLREILPYSMLGVNAPGILLECATLTHPGDRARITGPDGLADLAATIADGVEAYQRND